LILVRAGHRSGEAVQLKTFHDEKEQRNTEQKTPSDASNTQVVVDAAVMIALCAVALCAVLGLPYCPHDLSFIPALFFSRVTLFAQIIVSYCCLQNAFLSFPICGKISHV